MQLLREADLRTAARRMAAKHSTAVIDPDDRTFWVARPLGVTGGFSTAIGHIVP